MPAMNTATFREELTVIGGPAHERKLADTGQQKMTVMDSIDGCLVPCFYVRHPRRPFLIWDNLRIAKTLRHDCLIGNHRFAGRGDLLYAVQQDRLWVYNCESGETASLTVGDATAAKIVLGPPMCLNAQLTDW